MALNLGTMSFSLLLLYAIMNCIWNIDKLNFQTKYWYFNVARVTMDLDWKEKEEIWVLHVLDVLEGSFHILLQHLVSVLFSTEFVWK